jgi:hypothetical protein
MPMSWQPGGTMVLASAPGGRSTRPSQTSPQSRVSKAVQATCSEHTFTDSLNGATDARCAMVVVYGVCKERRPYLHGSLIVLFYLGAPGGGRGTCVLGELVRAACCSFSQHTGSAPLAPDPTPLLQPSRNSFHMMLSSAALQRSRGMCRALHPLLPRAKQRWRPSRVAVGPTGWLASFPGYCQTIESCMHSLGQTQPAGLMSCCRACVLCGHAH